MEYRTLTRHLHRHYVINRVSPTTVAGGSWRSLYEQYLVQPLLEAGAPFYKLALLLNHLVDADILPIDVWAVGAFDVSTGEIHGFVFGLNSMTRLLALWARVPRLRGTLLVEHFHRHYRRFGSPFAEAEVPLAAARDLAMVGWQTVLAQDGFYLMVLDLSKVDRNTGRFTGTLSDPNPQVIVNPQLPRNTTPAVAVSVSGPTHQHDYPMDDDDDEDDTDDDDDFDPVLRSEAFLLCRVKA